MKNLGWNIDAFLYDIFLGRVDKKLYKDVLLVLGKVKKGVKIDEFGCGTGELTRRLPKSAKIRAVDYSPNALKKVEQKTQKNVKVFCLDFYKKQPKGRPDILIACRSLYHKDVEKSMKMLSKHIGKGTVIIAHPQPSWWKYVFPKTKGFRLPSFIQLVKSYGRFANMTGQAPYALFSSKKWLKVAKKYFKNVKLYRAAHDTHYILKLSK
ncbi:MAG: class I SAM-dependent methyltransferase [Nanoarchaeota archaeon]|nr:class I SAM-dependent methyltransferase [Nanoarchaeota archaeon]